MTADHGEPERSEQLVEIAQGAAADQGSGAAGKPAERRQALPQRIRNLHRIRSGRDIDQCSVDIEQERRGGEVERLDDDRSGSVDGAGKRRRSSAACRMGTVCYATNRRDRQRRDRIRRAKIFPGSVPVE
jgi:hypothetical protein